MQDINTTSLIAFCVFSLFSYYQALHLKNFRGRSKIFECILSLFTGFFWLYGIGVFIYIGYTTGWFVPVKMFFISLLVSFVFFPIEVRFPTLKFTMSFLGFFVVPISAYFFLAPHL